MVDLTRAGALALDAADPLRQLRSQLVTADDGLIYLDGNSLGRLPVSTIEVSRDLVERQWGEELIRGWSHWVSLPTSVGDELASTLLGAQPGEVVACDNTTTNLYKLAVAALRARPDRPDIVTDDDNFPTDRFVLESVAAAAGGRLRVITTDPDLGVTSESVAASLDDRVGLVSLSHVAYRSGALADMAGISAVAGSFGAWTLWDLSHSVGSVPVDLSVADLAVGCTYKYVNGGPGAPAFLYVRRDRLPLLDNPIPGWFGADDMFAMSASYSPRGDAGRFLTGTPDVGGLLRVREGLRLLGSAGIEQLRDKGMLLTSYLVELVAELPVRVASPTDAARRGSHIVLEHPQAWQLTQALIARGVIPDYRVPDRLRLGPAPLYTSFAEVWDGIDILRSVLTSGEHLGYPTEAAAVT